MESNESKNRCRDEHDSAENIGGTKTAAKSTFSFELFTLTYVSNVLDMYFKNPCTCLSMSLINPLFRRKTQRL